MLKKSLFLLLILVLTACNSQTQLSHSGDHVYTNALINSSSPYLLQHAHNPVNWYPWGEEALQKAKKEDKFLIISVGYSACHWCHVMEHESFEDTAVARLMNEHFVSIKVDKEERPDIDQIYMNAAAMATGNTGWPLNAVAFPDGRPFFGGTYFPKDRWTQLLSYFVRLKEQEPEKLEEAASQITAGIQKMDVLGVNPNEVTFSADHVDEVFANLSANLDYKKGGLDRAPKFPMPKIHEFLLQYYAISGEEKALKAVEVSLDEMLAGGIYDQVGGGFARYSTDAVWKLPHFEKMLYDNSQLVSLYAQAWQLTRKDAYKRVVYETLDFVERELLSEEGSFFTSLDADSEGEEGKYYVWTEAEITEVLGADAAAFNTYFNVSAKGNWEHSNILYQTKSHADLAKKLGMEESDLTDLIARSKPKLLETRARRIRPGLDDKTLTAWNALMIKGYVDAYRVFGEERFLQTAKRNAAFLQEKMLREDGGLNRIYKDDVSSINGFLDDYSFTIEAFIALYQATFEEQWLFEADQLMTYVSEHFFDVSSGMYYFTSDQDEELITRSREIPDNVIPSSNSSLAKGLFLLGTYLYKQDYIDRAEQMLNNVYPDLQQNGAFYANWAKLLAYFAYPPFEVAIVGERAVELRKELDEHFLPRMFVLGGKDEGKLELLQYKRVPGATFIYVCQNKACKFPVEEVSKALELMK
ncbi:MAG: thioredoxin domain-containing protein [Bacteroidota bacterium]